MGRERKVEHRFSHNRLQRVVQAICVTLNLDASVVMEAFNEKTWKAVKVQLEPFKEEQLEGCSTLYVFWRLLIR